MSDTDPDPSEYSFDHSVTSSNTVPHWVLYTLDSWESEDPEARRETGAKPIDVFEHAANDSNESIVYRDDSEVRYQMKVLAEDRGALSRRTDETVWHDDDVDWYYRLSNHGREALLDLGIPEYLPNRRDPEYDRQLPMEPNHEPGWWLDTHHQPEYDVEDGWDIDDNDWLPSETKNLYFESEYDRDMCTERGYTVFGEKLVERFPETTFVMTSGPYRPYDLMFRVRDPFRQVVQIDVYSPAAMSRSKDEMLDSFVSLVKDLQQSLRAFEVDSDD